jgi:magnesium transporter
MLTAYVPANGSLTAVPVSDPSALPQGFVWLDLVSPSEGEDKIIEQALGIEIPTREEMGEIEQSSRLYIEGSARYMTAAVLCGAETETPFIAAISFILAGTSLVTVRYGDPRPFTTVKHRLGKACPISLDGESVLIQLLDAVVDRAADVLEQIGADVERISHNIFRRERVARESANQRYRAILSHIGRKEGLVSSARESLASLQRMLSFLGTETDGLSVTKDHRAAIKSMSRDVAGLSDYAAFIGDKLQFLLDATIGMVGLEQNNIIKIFAVITVVLMPPTLIGAIYGMNFKDMPELDWAFGYPMALGIMLCSAVFPYLIFKWRGWL